MIAFASMEPALASTVQQQNATSTSGYIGRGRGSSGDFKRNFNCYKYGKYGHFAAQCPEPDKLAAPKAKQPKPATVISKAEEDDAKAYGELWPYALKTAERDSLLVYAYIAKSKAKEAWVEEKRKQDEEAAVTSKRATKSSNKKEEVPKPSCEVNMQDALKDKKQGKPRGPSYKLKSDIELATDLKKVFEERILNSKVEMTLGDILGIAKHEFHEEIIDIIKRKWQIPSDQEPEGVKS
ncbi:hypothetical protein L7F22_054886 [Adiantum nelumboides]|nr:hypothetical protein [Adiantum nelumboides]